MARTFTITYADIQRCPIHSLLAGHYRDDGTCLCVPARPADAASDGAR